MYNSHLSLKSSETFASKQWCDACIEGKLTTESASWISLELFFGNDTQNQWMNKITGDENVERKEQTDKKKRTVSKIRVTDGENKGIFKLLL